MTNRNWKAALAIAIAPLLFLAPSTKVWAQPPSEPSSMSGSPVTQPTATPTSAPVMRSSTASAPTTQAAATTPTIKYSRESAIEVGEIKVEGNKTVVSPGEKITLSIDPPSDLDTWTSSDGRTGKEVDDTLFGKWSNGGTGYSITWTAPTTQGEYRPRITVNDDINRGSTNGRNDLLVEVAVTITVKKYAATIANPTGNPKTAGKEGDNQFTFDDSTDGYAYIRCEAKLTPAAEDAADTDAAEKWAEDHISWSISGIEDSEIKWGEGGPDAFVEKDNKGKVAWIQLKGLPNKNSGFGSKTVTMTVDGTTKTASIELFFSKDATNHPGSAAFPPSVPLFGVTPHSPNWFYYWNQLFGGPNVYYIDPAPDGSGYVPALGKWSLSMPYAKNEIWIGKLAAGSLIRTNNGVVVSSSTGIDAFANTIRHEKVHLDQIVRADNLLTQKTGIWAKGWAWTFDPNNPDDTPNNRYNPGPPVDDLDANGDRIPNAWGANYPGLEQEAQAAETIADGTNAELDWSNPGKQY